MIHSYHLSLKLSWTVNPLPGMPLILMPLLWSICPGCVATGLIVDIMSMGENGRREIFQQRKPTANQGATMKEQEGFGGRGNNGSTSCSRKRTTSKTQLQSLFQALVSSLMEICSWGIHFCEPGREKAIGSGGDQEEERQQGSKDESRKSKWCAIIHAKQDVDPFVPKIFRNPDNVFSPLIDFCSLRMKSGLHVWLDQAD